MSRWLDGCFDSCKTDAGPIKSLCLDGLMDVLLMSRLTNYEHVFRAHKYREKNVRFANCLSYR